MKLLQDVSDYFKFYKNLYCFVYSPFKLECIGLTVGGRMTA